MRDMCNYPFFEDVHPGLRIRMTVILAYGLVHDEYTIKAYMLVCATYICYIIMFEFNSFVLINYSTAVIIIYREWKK